TLQRSPMPRQRLSSAGVTENPLEDALLWLDVGRSDDLAPFLGFLGEELAEIRGRHRQRHSAEVGQPGLYPWFRKGRVDFSVEPIDDFRRTVLGAAEADHKGRFVARQKFADGWEVWQRFGTHGRGHRQPTQLAGPDVPDHRWRGGKYCLHLTA